MDNLPRPPGQRLLPSRQPSFSLPASWAHSRQIKVVLTIIAMIYLLAQLGGMAIGIIAISTGFGEVKHPPVPWPVYLLWLPGFLFQLGIITVALWLLWKPAEKGRLQYPPDNISGPAGSFIQQ